MAQPLANVPPLRICSFGSNNKFTSDDVRRRVETIRDELKQAGITMLTYAADGDTRELKFMRENIQLGISPPKRKRKSFDFF